MFNLINLLFIAHLQIIDLPPMPSDLAQKRRDIEEIAFSIKGVIGVADGVNRQGQPVIKILLSQPQYQLSLPAEFFDKDIELEFVGDIKSF